MTRDVKLVYVAGPFSAPTRDGVERNIRAAEALGVEVARLGACPIVPHCNTSHPSFESVQPYEFWIAATLEMLRRCDAVIFVPGWETSSGARGERADAIEREQPVFDSVADLAAWLAVEDGTAEDNTAEVTAAIKAMTIEQKARIWREFFGTGIESAATLIEDLDRCRAALNAANAIIGQEADEAARLQREIDRLRGALEKVSAIVSDREAFVMLGPHAFAAAERVAREALESV